MNITTDSTKDWRRYWPHHWLQQELIWLLATIFVGILILPALIYLVGSRLFGAYSGTGTPLAAFYHAFAQDLAAMRLNAWMLALGPLVMTYLLRLVLGLPPFDVLGLHKHFRKGEPS